MSKFSEAEGYDIYKSLKSYGEKLIKKPDDFSKLRDFSDELGKKILSIRNTHDFGLAYFLYLNLVDILYNILEEGSLKDSHYTQLARVAGDRFIKIYELKKNGRDKEVFLPILEIVDKFREINSQYDHILEAEEQLKYKNMCIPIRLSMRNNTFCVAGYPHPIFFNLDELLITPERVKIIGRAFVKQVEDAKEREGTNKLCFIEKPYGPIGAISLLPYLVEKTRLPAVIYRPLHWNFKSKITGSLSKSDKLCLVYDLAMTGGALLDTISFFKKNYKGLEVVSSIVLYDYGMGAREKLWETYHTKLRPVIELSEEKIRKLLLQKYKRERRKLRESILRDKISYDEYRKEEKELFETYARLRIFAKF